jgi:hypothetical protein
MGMDSIILTGMISLSCGNISDTKSVKNACSTGIEAAARQSGIYENIKKEEDKLAAKAENKIKEHMSPTTIEIVSTMVLSGRLLFGQNSSFRLGKGPLGENYVFETNSKDFYLKIGWDL